MENTNDLTQEERFKNLQEFKRNLSARLEARAKVLQEELDKRKAEERRERLNAEGYNEYSDME